MIIQWYPGHMAKARRQLQSSLAMVDLVVELVDARIPFSSRNPELEKLIQNKPRIILLNKADLADEYETKKWLSWLKSQGIPAIAVNSIKGLGLKDLVLKAKEITKDKMAALVAKGRRPRPIRMMVVGIPNVGKSSLINSMVKKASTRTGDKPGVTKGQQWVRIHSDLELLDTPGVLWPKFEDMQVGLNLALTGAISDTVYDLEKVVRILLNYLAENHSQALQERYKLTEVPEDPDLLINEIGRKRGCLLSGGIVDELKVALIVLQEFRAGRLGNFTLEGPDGYFYVPLPQQYLTEEEQKDQLDQKSELEKNAE